jgi:hypothetical protein
MDVPVISKHDDGLKKRFVINPGDISRELFRPVINTMSFV